MILSDVESVFVHWSESVLINDELGHNENTGDIDKQVDPVEFDHLVQRAANGVFSGYDKTKLTVKLKNGEVYDEVKFYLTQDKGSLVRLLA